MEVHDTPGKRDVFSWAEAEGFHNLVYLEIKIRIAGGSCGQDMCDSAIRADAYKKRGGIKHVGIPSSEEFAGRLRQACSQVR